MDEQLYTVAQAAEAAGIVVGTLRNWMQIGKILLGEQDKAAPAGSTRKLSLRRVYQVAVTAELASMGVAPAIAGKWALMFSDVGNGERAHPLPAMAIPERLPSELYPTDGKTWLVAVKSCDMPQIIWVKPEFSALLITRMFSYSDEATYVLPLNPLVARVRQKLGIND